MCGKEALNLPKFTIVMSFPERKDSKTHRSRLLLKVASIFQTGSTLKFATPFPLVNLTNSLCFVVALDM